VTQAPILISEKQADITKKLVPVKGKPLQFTFSDNLNWVNKSELVLEPFFRIHDARYMMYWMALTPAQYNNYIDSIANAEREKLDVEKRTVDVVATGEQQSEVDHVLQRDQSRRGTAHKHAFREGARGGFFSYSLATNKETSRALMVRYWGAENGSRSFDIYI